MIFDPLSSTGPTHLGAGIHPCSVLFHKYIDHVTRLEIRDGHDHRHQLFDLLIWPWFSSDHFVEQVFVECFRLNLVYDPKEKKEKPQSLVFNQSREMRRIVEKKEEEDEPICHPAL